MQRRRMRERGCTSTNAQPRHLMRAPYRLIVKMPPANFAETLAKPQLSGRPHPESWSHAWSSSCENLTLPLTSAGLLSDHEDGSEMSFQDIMLSQDMAGGCGESCESPPVWSRPNIPLLSCCVSVWQAERERVIWSGINRSLFVFVAKSPSANAAARWLWGIIFINKESTDMRGKVIDSDYWQIRGRKFHSVLCCFGYFEV
jgi:hypothetical protein